MKDVMLYLFSFIRVKIELKELQELIVLIVLIVQCVSNFPVQQRGASPNGGSTIRF
jgi:hypothetical protein